MVVGSGSFNASHRRSTGLLLLWWWAAVVSMLHKIIFIIVTEDWLYYLKINCIIGTWKTNCCVGRSTVLFQNRLYYWKINCDAGISMVLLEDQLYWRQWTRLDGDYWSRKITARRWLHKYVGAECSASSFTWYLYQICNTDVRLSVCGQNGVRSVSSTILIGSISYLHILSSNFRRCVACNVCFKIL